MSTSPPPPRQVFDIAVVGAGAVGLAFAAAMKQAMGRRASVAVVDPRPRARDGHIRTVALSEGSRRLLERIGAWTALEPLAQPITKMTIYDGEVRDAVRLKQLEFAVLPGGDRLAHMAFNDDALDALAHAAAAQGVEIREGAVESFEAGASVARLGFVGGGGIDARLVVAADGGKSRLRSLADIPSVGWSTGQTGMVATVAHERDHEGVAEQHFLPAGPFAILPLRGRRSSIVWNESQADAKALLSLDEDDLLRQLERRFTLKLGEISLVSPVQGFDFAFRVARRFVAPRLALIGDAAHVVHPLAGQGLNLGLRDAASLAERIVEPLRLGLDPADPAALEAYQRDRRFDVVASSMGMDVMNRLFSNDIAPLRMARDFGLRLVDRAPPLKRLFMAEASGAAGRAPRLMRGLGL